MDALLELDKQWETLHGTTPTVDELIDAAKSCILNAEDADSSAAEQDPPELIKEM